LVIDPDRATLKDLVEDVLRLQLGYGEDLTVNNEVGIVYDLDLEDNLPKKFSEMGIVEDSFLTIIDDEGEEPRVNLQLSISTRCAFWLFPPDVTGSC
jgi:ubiquitin-like 1-activating enzyme E1 B